MIIKKILTFVFMLTTLLAVSQREVCHQSSTGDDLLDLNTIGKCTIEKFKKSKNKGYVSVATRNRYVRKKPTAYTAKINEVYKANAIKKEVKDAVVKKAVIANSTVTTKEVLRDYVRFDKVTQIPVFLTCAEFSYDHKDVCKKETLVHHILENLIYPFDAAAEGIEGRVWVRFIVDKEGHVKNITTSGPPKTELLETEAERLISLLPKFMPGKLNGDYVNVEYFIPIDFQLDE